MQLSWLPQPYATRVRRLLIESSVVLLIAIALPGAGALETAWSFLQGAILFGGGMAVLLAAMTVINTRWRRRKGDSRPLKVLSDESPGGWWRWTAVFAVLLSLVYLASGPESVAFLAGFGPGAVVSALATHLLTRRLQPA
jgi:hypothetical protein